MIQFASPHPEDDGIVVHAWTGEERAPRPILSGQEGNLIPDSHVRRISRDWPLRKLEEPNWRMLDLDGMMVSGSVAADDLRASGVYAKEFERMLEEAIGEARPVSLYRIHGFGDKSAFCKFAQLC
jgi:hypothetical protein